MAKPVLLTVDDDPEVLRAVARDLRRKYGSAYRVVPADSAASALDVLGQLTVRNETVALFLVDQRMPRMNGVEFLTEAIKLFPKAKRVLLTAYADTDAAIRAINTARIDYYLLKPWDPPEQELYPILDDLLEDWQAGYRPPFEGIRVIGHRWSPQAHQIKSFLAGNHVPYNWLDVEADPEALTLLAQLRSEDKELPVVIYPDSTHEHAPANAQIASKVGLNTQAVSAFYDLVIVGGGPAGLAAAVYGASEGLRTVIIEREAPGGQAGTSSRIENYLGFPTGLSGADLARRAVTQARRFGVEILSAEASELRLDGVYRYVRLADGTELSCHALLIATGVAWRRLAVPGMDTLTGAGVYYGAAMTEAISCRDEDVFLVGGANSAGQAALHFAKFARKVTMLVRADSLSKSMSQYLIDEIEAVPNIAVQFNSNVVAVEGTSSLAAISISNSLTSEVRTVPASSLFVFIGALPHTDWLDGIVERDERGFIPTGPELLQKGRRPHGWTLDRDPFLLETSVPGIFVAGDVRQGSVKRIASGVGEGAMAVQLIHQYLSKVL